MIAIEINPVNIKLFDVKKNFHKLSVRYTGNEKLDVNESVRGQMEDIHTSGGKRKRAEQGRVSSSGIEVGSIDKMNRNGKWEA